MSNGANSLFTNAKIDIFDDPGTKFLLTISSPNGKFDIRQNIWGTNPQNPLSIFTIEGSIDTINGKLKNVELFPTKDHTSSIIYSCSILSWYNSNWHFVSSKSVTLTCSGTKVIPTTVTTISTKGSHNWYADAEIVYYGKYDFLLVGAGGATLGYAGAGAGAISYYTNVTLDVNTNYTPVVATSKLKNMTQIAGLYAYRGKDAPEVGFTEFQGAHSTAGNYSSSFNGGGGYYIDGAGIAGGGGGGAFGAGTIGTATKGGNGGAAKVTPYGSFGGGGAGAMKIVVGSVAIIGPPGTYQTYPGSGGTPGIVPLQGIESMPSQDIVGDEGQGQPGIIVIVSHA